jgi:hypothetical protein
MFVRNNTTCSSCGKCATFDLYTSSGLFQRDGTQWIGCALQCIYCCDLIDVVVDPLVMYDLIRTTMATLPARAMWNKQFRHLPSYANLVHEQNGFTFSWVASCGFIRNICDPDLNVHPLLQNFVAFVLDRKSALADDEGTLVYVDRNDPEFSPTVGQSLAN